MDLEHGNQRKGNSFKVDSKGENILDLIGETRQIISTISGTNKISTEQSELILQSSLTGT